MVALLDLGVWVPILDGDRHAAAMYERHYSSEKNRKRRRDRGTLLFLGPGEKLVLSTPKRDALFAWRRATFRRDGEEGVECAVFRNEGGKLSSLLIMAADEIADRYWPGERHFTYVDPTKTESRRGKRSPPGACFIHAGWRLTDRVTPTGLIVLERPDASL